MQQQKNADGRVMKPRRAISCLSDSLPCRETLKPRSVTKKICLSIYLFIWRIFFHSMPFLREGERRCICAAGLSWRGICCSIRSVRPTALSSASSCSKAAWFKPEIRTSPSLWCSLVRAFAPISSPQMISRARRAGWMRSCQPATSTSRCSSETLHTFTEVSNKSGSLSSLNS